MSRLGADALTVSSGEPSASARQAVRAVFTSWPGAPLVDDPAQVGILDRVLSHLTAVPPSAADAALLNAQISVDTARPEQLRLTIDPLAGTPLSTMECGHVLAAVASLESPLLERSVEAVYRDRRADELPHSLWLGFAPGANGHVAKAYLSSREAGGAAVVAAAARAAGWLPDRLAAAVERRYERLVPIFAAVEGVGLAYRANARVGTTIYLRGLRPWSMCASDVATRLIGIESVVIHDRVLAMFGGPPTVFGWSIECDDRGELVDVKLEVGASGSYSPDALRGLGEDFDIDTIAVSELATAIEHRGLGREARPIPAVISLRFVSGHLIGIVVYFPLAVPAGPDGHCHSRTHGSVPGRATRSSAYPMPPIP
jgi:hypothetical protein